MLYTAHADSLYHPPSQVDPLGFGKVAVVTGCASGIGLAVTQLLLSHVRNPHFFSLWFFFPSYVGRGRAAPG